MNDKFDVIVIGGGPGGTPAAMQLAANGKKVLLAEESGKLGGACLFVGCIPSKIIKHKSDVFNAGKATVSHEDPAQTWQTIRHEMDFIISKRSQSAVKQITQMPITFVTGPARFVSRKEVEINNIRYWFDKAIIATGSHSFMPPFKGNEVKEVLTSAMLFQLPALPSSLLIIGGGATGVEIAQMFAKLKVKCVILETMPGLLSEGIEPEFAEEIAKKLQATGIEVHTHAKVEEINKIDGKFQTVFMDAEGKQQKLLTEKVFVVIGTDTLWTVSDTTNSNYFRLSGFTPGTYTVKFMPADTTAIADTVSVIVHSGSNIINLDTVRITK